MYHHSRISTNGASADASEPPVCMEGRSAGSVGRPAREDAEELPGSHGRLELCGKCYLICIEGWRPVRYAAPKEESDGGTTDAAEDCRPRPAREDAQELRGPLSGLQFCGRCQAIYVEGWRPVNDSSSSDDETSETEDAPRGEGGDGSTSAGEGHIKVMAVNGKNYKVAR